MHNKTSFSVIKDYASVDSFLQEALGNSRSQVKKQGFSKSFLAKKLSRGECLSLPLDFVNQGHISPLYSGPKIEIIYEDDYFLALNKPHNLHGHPHSYHEQQSLLNYIRSEGKGRILSVNQGEAERGLLYRLDGVTSGLMIYIKDEKLFHQLRENFQTIAKQKKYLAIVKGNFLNEGPHSHFFQSKGKSGMKMIASSIREGQVGKASFKKVYYDQIKNLSLVEISLLTGLRHQIRSQLAALNYPILGDQLYGGDEAERVFLHAYQYELEWEGRKLSVEARNAPLFNSLISLDHYR